MIRILFIAATLMLLLVSYSSAQQPPLVDGDCSEYEKLKSRKLEISKDVPLRIYQDKHFVWLCYEYPDGSFATADLKLFTRDFPSGINLHVSAQLGECQPEMEPQPASVVRTREMVNELNDLSIEEVKR